MADARSPRQAALEPARAGEDADPHDPRRESGDVGHQWIAKRYVFRAAPWVPFNEETSDRTFVYAPSVFTDNPFIDRDGYRGQLEASCPSDPELLRAWLEGDRTVSRGAFFGSVLEEKRNAVAQWPHIPWGWEVFLAHDFGSSAPSVTYIIAKSPGAEAFGQWFARDSLILVDELATNEPGNVSKGLGWTVPKLAEAIHELCQRWEVRPLRHIEGLPTVANWAHVRPMGVADDAIFAKSGHSTGSIADEFRAAGVTFMRTRAFRSIPGVPSPPAAPSDRFGTVTKSGASGASCRTIHRVA